MVMPRRDPYRYLIFDYAKSEDHPAYFASTWAAAKDHASLVDDGCVKDETEKRKWEIMDGQVTGEIPYDYSPDPLGDYHGRNY